MVWKVQIREFMVCKCPKISKTLRISSSFALFSQFQGIVGIHRTTPLFEPRVRLKSQCWWKLRGAVFTNELGKLKKVTFELSTWQVACFSHAALIKYVATLLHRKLFMNLILKLELENIQKTENWSDEPNFGSRDKIWCLNQKNSKIKSQVRPPKSGTSNQNLVRNFNSCLV